MFGPVLLLAHTTVVVNELAAPTLENNSLYVRRRLMAGRTALLQLEDHVPLHHRGECSWSYRTAPTQGSRSLRVLMAQGDAAVALIDSCESSIPLAVVRLQRRCVRSFDDRGRIQTEEGFHHRGRIPTGGKVHSHPFEP
jgi:hypothetical protein